MKIKEFILRFSDRAYLFWSLWIFLAFFPIGYGFREVMPPLAFCFALCYYKEHWSSSNLRQLPKYLRYCFYAFLMLLFIGVFFSTNRLDSLLHAGVGINKAYILPFLCLEAIHSKRDLELMCLAMAIAVFWLGLSAFWQLIFGADPIMGYQMKAGRLSGTFSDYAGGNYLVLALIPAFAIYFKLKSQQDLPQYLQKIPAFSSQISRYLLFIVWLIPPLFYLLGASSRSSLLALVGAGIFFLIFTKQKNIFILLFLVCFSLFFAYFAQGRLNPANILDDGRWSLWTIAFFVFLLHPVTGVGINQYNVALQSLNLKPSHDSIFISHPHNMYLDLLSSEGILGFMCGIIFLFGTLAWLWQKIRPKVLTEIHAHKKQDSYWQMTTLLLCGYFAWLVNGIFGHDFYRSWWLAIAMSLLGLAIGAILGAKKTKQEIRMANIQRARQLHHSKKTKLATNVNTGLVSGQDANFVAKYGGCGKCSVCRGCLGSKS